MSKLTTRITAMLLAGMLVIGSVPGSVLAASTDVDPDQTSEIVEEVYEDESSEAPASEGEMAEIEETSEVPMGAGETAETAEEVFTEDTSEAPVAAGDTSAESFPEEASVGEAAVQFYTVTLDANGGYFENEWDDAIRDYARQAEVVEKHIPVDGTVTAFPVFNDPDGQIMLFAGWSLERDGELVTMGDEEYAPVDNCVLYAVWQAAESEDAALAETEGQEVADENSEQVDSEKESDSIQHSMEAGGEGISNIAINRQYNENEQIEDPKVIESEDGIEEVTSEQNMNDGDDDDPQVLYPQVAFEEEEILAVAGYNKYLEYSASNIEGEYLDYDLIWESSRTDIALISSDGYLRPLRAGETIVSLSVEGTDIVASCKVTVVDPERESEYHLTKKDFEDVQEVEPGLIVGGLRKNTYGNVFLLPGKYIINEDICLDDMKEFYYEDNGEYSFSGEGSFYDSRIGDDGHWSTGTANYIFEDFTLNNVLISCYGIKIIGGNYKGLTLVIKDGCSMNNPGIYSGYFEGLYVWNENAFFEDNRFTIYGGEFLNGTISGRGGDTDIIDGSFKDVCVRGCCSIYGGVFVTEKEDYAIEVGWDNGLVYVFGGYFKGKIAAANSMQTNRLYLRGGTFENGQVGAVIIPTGYSSHQEAGKTIKNLLEPYGFKNAEYFEIVMDGDYYDVAKGIDGSVDVGFNIEKYDVKVTDAVYTGQNIIPEYRIIYPENMYYPNLTLGTDYELKVENNFDVGTGKLTINGKGEFFGTITSTFKIKPAPISNVIVAGLSDKTYNGASHTQSPIVKMGSTTLKENSDYNVSFANNINAGRATITIAGKGRYTGSKNISFMIKKAAQSITASNLSLTFPNSGKITASGNKGSLSYKSSNTAIATVDSTGKVTAKGAGKATITIIAAATNNYNAATKTITVNVAKAAQSITAKVAASSVAVGKTTTVSIMGNKGKKSYKSSNTAIATVDSSTGKVTAKKVGTVKITATSAATAQYNAASKTVTIKVVPAATTSLTAANQATGIKLTWNKVTGANGYKVYRGSTLIKTITSGSTVTFADTAANTNGTKYTYKIVAKASTGDSTLSKSVAVYRVARPTISSATNSAASKMTVKWGKNAKANGYQIQYSLSSSFASGNKAVTITSASTVSKVIGSLTKGKTYYIRIRTYKTVGSTKYWSEWSAKKSVKISK